MTIGLALIARDEHNTLPHLLESITGAFDQVAFVDTGSTDDTLGIFTRWARDTGQDHVIDTFEWTDDFAAARNHAHSLLTTHWHCWADCDDLIINADQLRDVVFDADPESTAIKFEYLDHGGRSLFPRPRLFCAGTALWTGRIHEQLLLGGQAERSYRAHWLHTRDHLRNTSNQRNARITRDWQREDPDSLVELLMRREITLVAELRELQNVLVDVLSR